MMGYVKHFNPEKGYGFIAGQDGDDYFVHYTKIAGTGYRVLMEGQEVEFDLAPDRKGKVMAVEVKVVDPDVTT